MNISKIPLKLLMIPFKAMIKRLIKHPALKRYIVTNVNERVDIPKLTEKQEEELFSAHVNAMIQFIDEWL